MAQYRKEQSSKELQRGTIPGNMEQEQVALK